MSSLALAWFVRFRRVQLPMLTLIAFLQRTPVLRLLLGAPSAWLSGSAGQVLRSTALVGVAAGAVDTLAGATTFTASPASPASATAGTPFNAAFAVTGAPSAVKSYTISNLPPGLTVTGATASGSNLLLNASTGTISGTPTTAGNYSATITAWEKTGGTGNSKGYSYTIAVTGSAATAPSITTQPSGQTVTAGASASFSVTASGTAPLSYQWRKDGTDIGGATASTYAISTTAMTDAGTYTVVVSNSAGSVTSSGATLTVNAAAIAPSITTQPVAQTVNTGASVSFSVTASGTAPLSYQWRKDGANIASATSATYTIGSAATTDAGTYSVVVSNSVGSATSNGAALTVNVTNTATAPSITAQPVAQTVNTGASVSFSVTASGTAPLSYQWRKDGADIGSATSATYTIGSAATTDAGTYSVVVSNSVGSATSNGAALTVNVTNTATAPSITTQPAAQTVNTGVSVSFSVTASGTAPLSYQWRKDGANIASATSATYTIGSAATTDAGTYSVVVSNSAGSATSNGAALTVNVTNTATAPSITTQPVAQTVNTGVSVSFSVTASGTAPLSYQWRKDGANIGSATSATYTIGSAATTDAAAYTVVVTNSAGSVTSNPATLTVNVAPTAIFPHLAALAIDGSGRLYAVDSTNATVSRIAADGSVYLVAGSSGSTGTADGTGSAARFNQPGGLAATNAGVLYVADTANALIRRISAEGVVTTLAGNSSQRGNANGTGAAATFSAPVGLALDSGGNLYVADSTNHTVRKVTSSGAVTTYAGQAGLSGSANGSAARFNNPTAVAIDSAGNVFVADTNNNTIRKIAPSGDVSTFAGVAGVAGSSDGTGSASLFNQPRGLAFDNAGNLYVADTGNSTLRKIAPSGAVTTVAGLSAVSAVKDDDDDNDDPGTHPVSTALFDHPLAVAVESAGSIYLGDTGASAVRKVDAQGHVTTLTLTQVQTPPSSGGTGNTNTGSGNTGTGGTGSTSAVGGGGGGAPSPWWSLAVLAALAARRRRLGLPHR